MEEKLRSRDVNISNLTITVFEMVKKVERGEIQLKSDYQRNFYWTNDIKSSLIESIILNIPTSLIFLSEESDHKYEIIDGRQRIKTIVDYLNNEFPVKNTRLFNESKLFKDLEPGLQRKIEDYKLLVCILKSDSYSQAKFEIFSMLNNRGKKLNSQDLRNAIYRERGIPFIKKLAKSEEFKRLIQYTNVNKNSRQDEELVLRFMSFYYKGVNEYTGNLKKFLDSTLEEYDIYRNRENEFENVFLKTVNDIYYVFGEEAFVIRKEASKKNNKRKKISSALFDIITVSFSKYDSITIQQNKKLIQNKLYELLENNELFRLAVTGVSNTKRAKTQERFEIWERCLKDILGGK